MAQTVIGIFKNPSEARNAKQQLMGNGFSEDKIDISTQTETPAGDSKAQKMHHEDMRERISRFFHHLFGNKEDISKFSKAASQGTLVTVHAQSADEAELAADILDTIGAVNVDEYADNIGRRVRSRIVDRPVHESFRLRQVIIDIEEPNLYKDVDEKQKAVRESIRESEAENEDLNNPNAKREDDRDHYKDEIHRQRPGII